jgi:large subunit ribosomal protein L25
MRYNATTMTSVKTAPRAAKETKKDGFIPAVYYGSHAKSTPIFIDGREFSKVLASEGSSTSVTLVTEHGNETAMIQDVQYHPVKGHIVHADFFVLEKGQKVHVKTPIVFTGESAAVKAGGVLVKVMHELSIEGDPTKLPHEFAVDLALLVEATSVIHISDIKLPAGVELYHVNADDVVASVTVAQEEPVEAAPVDLASIEVEKKGKKEEEGEAVAE